MMWTTRQRSEIGDQPAIVAGRGRPVLLLHGVGLQAEAWGAQIDALSTHATVIAPDMPGHGENTQTVPDTDLTGFVVAAEQVLNSLEEPAVVVGHSMGAMTALALADRHPEQVLAVVALNAVFERDSAAAFAVLSRATMLDGATPADPTVTLQRWFGNKTSPERAACEGWLRGVDPAGYKRAYTAFAHSKVPDRDLLARLRCPALFTTGAAEPNSTPAMSRAMAEIAPQGSAVIVEGAAHMMPMTHATEVNAVLERLVQQVAQ